MVLFVLGKLVLQKRMCIHPLGLDVWFLVRPFAYFHTSCVRTAKALERLHGCASSPEPSLVACVISTKISWAGSVDIINTLFTCISICFTDLNILSFAVFSEVHHINKKLFLLRCWHYHKHSLYLLVKYEPHHEKTSLCHMRTKKGADQPAHLRSLIRAFVVRCLDNIIHLLAIAEISRP